MLVANFTLNDTHVSYLFKNCQIQECTVMASKCGGSHSMISRVNYITLMGNDLLENKRTKINGIMESNKESLFMYP